MSRFWKRMNRILALILAVAIAFSNDSMLTVFATSAQTVSDNSLSQGEESDDGSQSEDGTTSGDGSQSEDGTTSGDGSQVEDGTTSGDGSQVEDGTTSDDGSQTQGDAETEGGVQLEDGGKDVSGNSIDTSTPQASGTVSANEPLATVIAGCLEGKTHEYEEIKAEDGTVTGYRCVFCQYEMDADAFNSETDILHEHSWARPEGQLVLVCSSCDAEHLECDLEEGYGAHIFELVQEEGQADKYRCLVCGYEKETLDEWDVTQEMFMQIMGLTSMAYELDGETSSLPTTIEQLRADEANNYYKDKTFNVQNFADLAALQLLSKDGFDFEGYTVNFVERKYLDGVSGDPTSWDLTGLFKTVFSGLGTETAPFKGTLTSYYTGGSLRFKTATPLLNYVATGATVSELQINAAISGDGSSPVGIIAAHVVPGTEEVTVSLANLSLSGTVNNAGGDAGILFGEVVNTGTTPIKLCYEQSDIALQASVTAGNAGGLAGRTHGNVEVYQGTVFTSGSINGSVSAGMLVGTINTKEMADAEGATVSTEGTLYIGTTSDAAVSAKVSGNGASGGLVGIMNQGKILRADGKTAKVIINGSIHGAIAGGLVGQLENTPFEVDQIVVNAAVYADYGSKIVAGGVFGLYAGEMQGTADSTEWQQMDAITINGGISGGVSAGGAIGFVMGSNLRIGAADTADSIVIKGTVTASSAAGGVIGTAQGQYIEVYNASVSNTISTATAIGGVIGVVGGETERTVVLVKDAKVSSTLAPNSDNKIQGGIYGEVCSNSMAAMDGTIDVSGLNIGNTTLQWGHIAGKQTEALVYFETDCEYTRPTGKNWVDDIGSYGGVYRNGTWGETNPLISYAQKDVTGTVEMSSGQWVLDTEADMMRLAIMLNSEGNFAADCFTGATKADLLKAEYSLCPEDGSFDLEESGIYALNRNDRIDSIPEDERFTGKFIGADESRISLKLEGTEERVTRQYYLSLFPLAGDGAVFENLQIVRNLRGVQKAAAGLAAYGKDDITVKNVDIEMTLQGSSHAYAYCYGGMFADYTAAAGTTLTVENSIIGGNITISQTNAYNDGQKQHFGGMIAEYRFTASGSNLPTIKINGLELTGTITSSSRLVSGMITHINSSNTNQDKVILAMDGIHIKDSAKLVITDDLYTGGFLGRMWHDVAPYKTDTESYSIKNLTVGENTTAAEGPYFASRGWYGCMVSTVTGRIQLKDTKIQNGTFNGTNSATGQNGLLFRDGYHALVEVEGYEIAGVGVGVKDIDYNAVNDKVAITGYSTGSFSDIVGNNVSDVNSYTNCGVVNIISPKFADEMIAYSNHTKNAGDGSYKTRYYYNLFGTSLAGEDTFISNFNKLDASASNLVITDADQMMIWHLTQYMNSSIRRYLAPYYTAGTKEAVDSAVNKNVSIQGKIDLFGKSYYPTSVGDNSTVSASNNAQIIFYGDKATDGTTKTPGMQRENFMMHAGLLMSRSGNVTVCGDDDYLTLSGTVSNLPSHSSALFVYPISGTKNIYKIRLKDLYIDGYNGEHGDGLLIGKIADDSDIQISWIETSYTSTDKKAAASLIGQVGDYNATPTTDDDTTNLKLDLTNINVDDSVNGIFQWSTLIDQNYYTDSTEVNMGRVRYLFTKEAYRGTDGTGTSQSPFNGTSFQGTNAYTAEYVTIGVELQNGVEYWNVDGMADFLTEITNWSLYLPYVCTGHANGKEIEVNPKNASITKGCGTYEDPYQISSAKQLLALSRYLINKDDTRYLEGWQIRKTGAIADTDSDGICEMTHADSDLKTYGADDFPTQDDLRQAYYVITEDIDFTALISVTDRNIAQEFIGLGTEDMPFAGVIVGEAQTDGTYPKIALPYKQVNNYCTNFGFIQYAKGAVVKDLTITSKETTDTTLTDVVRVSTNAGSVIACILGGDNIIDNVTVSNKIAVQTSTAAGGYVGVLRQGSLILRNMAESSLKNYKCGTMNTTNWTLDEFTAEQMKDDLTDDVADYPYVSGIVGRVENGFVMYEGITPAGIVVLAHEATSITGVYSHNVLPLSKTYDIIVESKIDGDKIPITSDGTNFKASITTAAQLQLVSMAINSDAFSVYYDQGGYDKQAVCRKAQYDEVGSVDSATDEYTLATKKDDSVYWFPYIYQYFTFEGVEAAASDRTSETGFYKTLQTYTAAVGVSTGFQSKLNAVTSDITASMTYELVHSNPTADISVVDYDLSVYRRGFRGFGATYRIFTSDAEALSLDVREDLADNVENKELIKNRALADFRANFNGNGATVKAEMINNYEKNIHTTALFNDLVNITAKNDYSITDLVVTGTFSNYDGAHSWTYSGDRAGAVVGIMRRPWTISNVTALDVNVESRGHAAGIAAWINPMEITGKKDYTFTECKVLSMNDADGDGKATNIRTVGGSSGGIIGAMSPRTSGELTDYSLTVKDCQVSGIKSSGGDVLYVGIENDGNRDNLQSNNYDEDYARGRCGGFIGLVGQRQRDQTNVRIKLTITNESNSLEKDIQYAAINGGDSSGGVLGEYYIWNTYEEVVIENITVADSKVESKNTNQGNAQEKLFGVGGIVGKVQKTAKCTINNCNVTDTDVRSLRTKATGTTKDLYAGGVIGFCYSYVKVYLNNVQVTGTLDASGNPQHEISTKNANVGGLIGSFAYYNSDQYKCYVEVKECTVSGMKIKADNRTEENIPQDVANSTSSEAAGGMFGWATVVDIKVEDAEVKNCVIQTGTSSAGGVIGAADTRMNTNLSNIVIDSCTIGNNGPINNTVPDAGAGGIIGKLNIPLNYGTQKLKTITVKDSYLYGRSTGGIAGYVAANQQIGNVWSDGSDYEIKIQNNYLLGNDTGGVIGKDDNSNKLCFKNVWVEDNTILALRKNDDYSAAGGFCGNEVCGSELRNLNHITIKNNRILSSNLYSKHSAGGMFGRITLYGNGKIYSYDAVVEDNEIGYCYYFFGNTVAIDNLLSSATKNQMQTIKTTLNSDKTENARLLSLSETAFVETLPASMDEADIANYSKFYGNLVGVYGGTGHAYFLAPTVTYSDAYTGVRPVVDVGSTSEGTVGNQLMSHPYAYRANIHVVYHEPDSSAENTAAAVWGSADTDKQRLFSMVNADAVLSEYQTAVADGAATSQLLDAYRLNVQDDSGNTISDIYGNVYNDLGGNGYLSPLKAGTGADKETLPMIVIDTQYGTADQLMTSILAALTGVGGVQNSGNTNRNSGYDAAISQIMGISVQAMKVEDGAISVDTSGRNASIKYTNSSNRIELAYNGFDTAEEDGDGTFSMLTITYKQKDYAAIATSDTNAQPGIITGETVTLQIPVFVIERLTIDTHLKIAEGEVYNADTAKEKGLCTAPLLANNSSYTLYTEYIYGDARNKYSTDTNPIRIEKTIGMTYKDENDNVCQTNFEKGTRLTLIDVCDSDKVYYYTVTGEETGTIKYTDFVDAAGNHYENKPIHGTAGMEIYNDPNQFVTEDAEKVDNAYVEKTFTYQNVAVERFLIIVDTAQVSDEQKNSIRDIRDYEITPQLSDDVMKRTTLTEHTDLQITRQPGLVISLIPPGEENEPLIEGMIEEEGKITIDATFQIKGDDAYWTRVLNSQTTTIDSANHYKYLDVGIYLTDKNGNRVKLPDNTNITVNGKQLQPWEEITKEETNLGAYVNQSTAYFYKDGRISFPLDVLKDMIQEEKDKNGGKTQGSILENCKFELSFANADLTDYTEEAYEVHLELLRVEDAEYPAGGEVIDTYVQAVPAARKTDLACALETEDLMELGINIYNQQTPMPHTIHFDFKLDFNGIISNNQTMNQQIADKYYTVTYRILEKTNRNGTPQYEPYTGDQLTLMVDDPSSGIQEELIKGTSSVREECNSVYITYHFDWSEIKNGTDSEMEGVITRDMKLIVNDAEKMDLSNYRIQASVMVSDEAPGDIDEVVNNSLSDFFVFTVAKLKTDLDY